jgi:SAM-dependent methyltransferase
MDPYERIAEFYDCEHGDFEDDIHFYQQAVPEGEVLEVGVGTGRVAAALAARGRRVHGLDPSESMLRRAREQHVSRGSLRLERGSLPDLPDKHLYDAVILSLNTLWHVTDMAAQVQSLRAAGLALQPGGLLLVDLTNPLAMADRGAQGEVRERFRGPCGTSLLIAQSAAWDDQAEQTLRLELSYDCLAADGSVTRTAASLLLRYLYRSELELMLQLAGLEVRQVFGSYDMDPFDATSTNILTVATRH